MQACTVLSSTWRENIRWRKTRFSLSKSHGFLTKKKQSWVFKKKPQNKLKLQFHIRAELYLKTQIVYNLRLNLLPNVTQDDFDVHKELSSLDRKLMDLCDKWNYV